MLSLISFMILLSSFIEYDNHESNTEYKVYYAFDNLYNNKPIIDSIMTNKSNIELIKANKLNEIESILYEIESIHEANIFRDFNFNLSINIVEREPLAYYEKNDSYIDLSGKIIKRNKELDDRLPILSGETSINNIKMVVDVIKTFNEVGLKRTGSLALGNGVSLIFAGVDDNADRAVKQMERDFGLYAKKD